MFARRGCGDSQVPRSRWAVASRLDQDRPGDVAGADHQHEHGNNQESCRSRVRCRVEMAVAKSDGVTRANLRPRGGSRARPNRVVCTGSTTGRRAPANSPNVCSCCTQSPTWEVWTSIRCSVAYRLPESAGRTRPDKGGFLSVVLWVHTCQVRDH